MIMCYVNKESLLRKENKMNLADIFIKVIDDKQGNNIARINFQNTHAVFDEMIICDASNSRLMLALIDAVEDACVEHGYMEYKKDKNADSGWVWLYCERVCVSVFLKESRAFYNIERLWQDFLV